jgi:predicted permease
MAILRWLQRLWRNVVHRDRVERDLDDEIRAAFDLAVTERLASGQRPDEARRAAAAEFRSVGAIKDRVRDVRAGALIDAFAQDCRYGARVLRHDPLFTLAAALSLALGIGATTTIFTVANGLLLRTAPGVAESSRLVDIVPAMKAHFGITFSSYAVYREIQERVTTLQDVYAYHLEPQPRSLRESGPAERVFTGLVTPNYFSALGVPAAAGRLFTEAKAGDAVIVLSHEFWTRRFAGDPGVIGRAVFLNGTPFVITGIAREGFRGMSVAAPDLWMPISDDTGQLMVGARLKPGVTRAQAAAELQAIGRTLSRERRGAFADIDWTVAFSSPLPAALRSVALAFVGLLIALVSLVLVIACANVAGVLLARASARRREIAVRVAIGAGRGRLIRQLATETLLLFAIGGAAGVALARVLTALLIAALPAFPVPIALTLPLDLRVLAFSAGLTLVAALLSGMAPALHASRADVVSALKDESQGPSDRLRLRNTFVIAQVAFSIVLVVAAGLLGRALGRVTADDPGFDARDVEVAALDLSMAGYSESAGRRVAADLIARLAAVATVESASVADREPGGPLRAEAAMRDRNSAAVAQAPATQAAWTLVEPGYFKTLRIPLVSGRDFTANDRRGMPPVAIVDESTARRLWPGETPIGRYLPVLAGRAATQERGPRMVVGVVRDVKPLGRQREMSVLCVYAPLQQVYSPQLTLLVRSARGDRLAQTIREAVAAIDPNLPVLSVYALADRQTGPVVLQLRIAALVSGAVGLVGLLLASIGVYGVAAYATARRTREIGVRMALGADRGNVMWMILRHGLWLVALGSIAGLTVAAAGSRVLGRLLFGLPPLDPITFGGAAALFMAVGLAACYLPARRATRISAMEALRYE